MNKKVCVVITARASYSRIKSYLLALKDDNDIQLQLIVSGSALLSKYGEASKVIEDEGFEINEKVHFLIEGNSPLLMSKSTGIALTEFSTIFAGLNPDAIVVIADRYETIAVSIAASYQNIPLIHIQGGEISGNIDNKVRNANSSLSDYHFVSNKLAKNRLIEKGFSIQNIFVTGCPSIDIAKKVLLNDKNPYNVFKKYSGVGKIFSMEEPYIVVLQHPVTDEFGSGKKHIRETLNAVKRTNLNAIWIWPNPDAGTDQVSSGIRHFREINTENKIHFFKNLEPLDFLNVLKFSRCIVGNSSVGIREASYLGVPSINIGSRQRSRDHSQNIINVGYDENEIFNAIKKTEFLDHSSSNLYGDGKAGELMLNQTKKILIQI